MNLFIQIGDLRTSVTFAIEGDLVVLPNVRTAYQDKFIESIQCKTRGLKQIANRSVAILYTFD